MIAPRAWLALALAGALVAGACADRATDPLATGRYAAAYDGICRAALEARQGKVDAARRTFTNRSHAALHELASAVEAKDRPVAGRLLEAKQAVEAELAQPPAAQLADKLARLAAQTATAIASTGDARPHPCPQKES